MSGCGSVVIDRGWVSFVRSWRDENAVRLPCATAHSLGEAKFAEPDEVGIIPPAQSVERMAC